MKKLMLAAAMVLLVTGCAYADVWDSVIGYIKAQETETGLYYNFDDKATHGYIGRTLAQDIFAKKVDLALVWDIKDAIGAEVSYTIKDGTVAPYVGVIAGTNRIEKIEADELGEAFIAVSGGIKF